MRIIGGIGGGFILGAVFWLIGGVAVGVLGVLVGSLGGSVIGGLDE